MAGVRRSPGLLAACAAALSCAAAPAALEVERSDAPAPWTHLQVADAPGDFHFVVIGDRSGGHRPGVFARAVEVAGLLRPAFVLSVGDLIEGGGDDPRVLDAMWDEFAALIEPLEMPFFHVPGNHDYANPAMARDWTRRFGPSFYHFRYRDVLFLVLNSELYSSYTRPGRPVERGAAPGAQRRFVERTLAAHDDARWTFVLLHQPLWEIPEARADWEHVEAALGERPYTVIAGHYHAYLKRVRRSRDYVILGTAGGASRLRGVERGEFDHVAMVTMRDDGPRIANLALEGVHDVDVHDAAARRLVGELDRVVTTLPLRADAPRLVSAEQRFALVNRSDRPVRVSARFAESPHFAVRPDRVERVLAPKSEETVAVTLHAAAPRDLARVTPALARWRVEAEGRRGPVVVESTAWLIPERHFPVPRPPRAVTVDGELGEWGGLRFALEDWPHAEGPADASLRFDLRADDDRLYLAVEVRDATPHSSAALGVGQQDGVTVALDARPDPARSRNAGVRAAIDDGTLASLLVVVLAPVDGIPEPLLQRFGAPAPAGLQRAVRRRDGGYTAELSVPGDFLDARAGAPWSRLRLNLVLHDADPRDGSVREHAWRPSRFGDAAVAIEGAGTFARDAPAR